MLVAEASSETPDTAKPADDVAMICHTPSVRVPCNAVKLESVRTACELADMDDVQTMGAKFRSLVERSGISYRDLAKAAGFSAASGIQRYVDIHNDKAMGVDVAKRFAAAMEGKGTPPIDKAEILALTGFYPTVPASNASQPIAYEGSSMQRMDKTLPVYGSALGAEQVIDGEAVELTTLNRAEVIEHRERPPILNGKRDVYGLYVQGSSMDPAFDDGDLLVVQKTTAISVGDFVVIYTRAKGERDDGETAENVLIKRLVRRTAQYIELRQYQPDITFRIPREDVLRIDKALRTKDLLS